MRAYGNRLTAEVNRKGVLDVDTVKGCEFGMRADPSGGCYQGNCYAAAIAKFRGLDFAQSITRDTEGAAHAEQIKRSVKAAPHGFFRVGTMGDPSHAWEHTAGIVEWLAPYAVPVIVTKHWRPLSDRQMARLVRVGAVLNTSVSALDSRPQLRHRTRQIKRYAAAGGISAARIVSCDFGDTPEGDCMRASQRGLFAGPWPVIDNPLRLPATHRLVESGTVRVRRIKDLETERAISVARPDAYLGHCAGCGDVCGLAFCSADHPKPASQQLRMEW